MHNNSGLNMKELSTQKETPSVRLWIVKSVLHKSKFMSGLCLCGVQNFLDTNEEFLIKMVKVATVVAFTCMYSRLFHIYS